MRRILRAALEEVGYPQILEAEHRLAALGLLERETMDVVLTDIGIPHIDGLALALPAQR